MHHFFRVRRVFCASSMTILLLYIPAKIKMSFIRKDDFFFTKIGIFCKSIGGPLIKKKMQWMVNWIQFLNQLDFVRRHTKVFMQNSSQWCLWNVQLLRTTVNWCWWCTLSATVVMFSVVRTIFGFSRQFLSLFLQQNTPSWRCFFSSKIRMQFSHKVMSQYLPAFFKRIHNYIRSAEE